jgi:iron(III) transport system permease protein
MNLRTTPLPVLILTAFVALLLGLFIAYPIGAVLKESFIVSGPMSAARLAEITTEALDKLPAAERAGTLARWASGADEAQRVDAYVAAYESAGLPVTWDRKAAYSDQAKALAGSLEALSSAQRAAVDAHFPLSIAMLHKRVALAFKVRNLLSELEFDRLRNGAEVRLGLDHYLALLQDPYLKRAAINSLKLAVATVAATVPIAFGLAYGIHAGSIPWPHVVRAVTLLPLVAPPVLVALATLMLFGRRGLVTHTLLDRGLGWIDADTTNLYGFFGVVAAQTLSCVPAAVIVLDNVLRRKNGRTEEAASGLGASHWAIMRHVTLPLAWPGLKRAVILVFILSLTDFGNPLLIGHDTPVLAGLVYEEITAFQNKPLAAALCVWMLLPALALYLILEGLGGRRRFATSDVAGASELVLPVAWRYGLTMLAGIFALLVIAVYGTMIAGAFVRVWGVDWSPTLGYFTQTGVNVGLAGTGYGSSDRGLETVWDSLRIAATAAPIGGLLAVLIAYVVERIRPFGSDLLAFLSLAPAILPGIIFGVGYIIAFNVPFGIKSLSLSGTASILVINIMFSKIYVGVLAARAALQRYDRSIEDAAESLGAGLIRRFVLVTLPMLRSAFLLGMLYVFVEGLTTLSSVIFLVSGHHKLAAVAIFNHANSSEFGYAAAKSLIIFLAALIAMAGIWQVERTAANRAWPRGASRISPGTLATAAGVVPREER